MQHLVYAVVILTALVACAAPKPTKPSSRYDLERIQRVEQQAWRHHADVYWLNKPRKKQ